VTDAKADGTGASGGSFLAEMKSGSSTPNRREFPHPKAEAQQRRSGLHLGRQIALQLLARLLFNVGAVNTGLSAPLPFISAGKLHGGPGV